MKKKFVYRKLKINNKEYYQLYKIVNSNEMIDVVNTKPGIGVDMFSQEFVPSENKYPLNDLLYTYYHLDGEELILESDPILITKLHEKFFQRFKDFPLIRKNDFNVSKLTKLSNQELSFQKESIRDVLNILKSNLDVLDSDISDAKKCKLKHNIIMYGPAGFGKKTFVNTIINNTSVPVAALSLVGNPEVNLRQLIGELSMASMGNLKQIEHGIVFIRDNIDSLDEELSNDEDGEYDNPYDIIEALMNHQAVVLGENHEVTIDLTKITYVLLKDTPTNNPENLADDGMTQELYDMFEDIICFNRLTKEQIKEVILNNPENPLNLYQDICKQMGKELVIADNFLDLLIDRAYYGIGGIELINTYIETMIKTRWNNKKIVLDEKAILNDVADYSYLEECIKSMEEDSLAKENSKEESESTTEENYESSKTKKIDLSKIREDYQSKLMKLREYVKGQDEPLKNILYHAIINDAFQNSSLPSNMKKERINHMLIRGGTGTGKSYITGLIAKSLNNKPYTVVDCKRFTQAGYVGKSVDDILIQLYHLAGEDLEKAQKGIVVLDEFDKLARGADRQGTDVSQGAVQESLLKMLEGAVFDLEIKNGNLTKVINFDTNETSFIGVGAFEGLAKIKEARIKRGSKKQGIGFQNNSQEETQFVDQNYTLEDMQEFGMDSQLLRRMPFHCDLNKLTKEDYKDIMLNAKGSSFKIKCELIESFGVKITYDEEFIDAFSEMVSKLGFGVSGIAVLTERIFAAFETKLFDDNYQEIVLNKECVVDPSKVELILEKQAKVYKKQLGK